MDNNDQLNVWYKKNLVGQIWRNELGQLAFGYSSSWLKKGFPISQQLPLTTDKFIPPNMKAHQFFSNLLPEAGARTHIIKRLKIVNTDFDLLRAIGGECAGALSILPITYQSDTEPSYKTLSDDEFKKMLIAKGDIAQLTFDNERPRLSLAGAQDKCPIYYDDKYMLPRGVAPSTHIIKFDVARFKHIPAYEYFLTKLADSIELPVVECQLKHNDNLYYLLIKRYDRLFTRTNSVERLHQEDFCQALGIGYEKKYQQDGGPSFVDCLRLIQDISYQPIIDSENLLKWQIFNILAGNSDGHGKNLAIISRIDQKLQLAPFYDLVCTRAIKNIDKKLAMSIGGEFDPDLITEKHWEIFADECGIRKSYLLNLIKKMAAGLLEKVNSVSTTIESENGPYPALQRAKQVLIKQCNKYVKLLNSN